MIIRTQNKKAIINMNNVDTLEVHDCQIRYYSGLIETAGLLGTYSTEEKAIKVLDMIQIAYEEANSVCSMSGFVANTVFQMPADQEV